MYVISKISMILTLMGTNSIAFKVTQNIFKIQTKVKGAFLRLWNRNQNKGRIIKYLKSFRVLRVKLMIVLICSEQILDLIYNSHKQFRISYSFILIQIIFFIQLCMGVQRIFFSTHACFYHLFDYILYVLTIFHYFFNHILYLDQYYRLNLFQYQN